MEASHGPYPWSAYCTLYRAPRPQREARLIGTPPLADLHGEVDEVVGRVEPHRDLAAQVQPAEAKHRQPEAERSEAHLCAHESRPGTFSNRGSVIVVVF